MRDYKGWTAKERLASLKKTKAAIAAGVIPPPTKCNRCGKESGSIDYHNHDYSDPVKYLEQLCRGCHVRLHRWENKEMNLENEKKQKYKKVHFEKNSPTPVKADIELAGKMLENVDLDLNIWLELGMKLPVTALAAHVITIPANVKPLYALRGLGIVFCNGFTKSYTCKGYPKKVGLGKDQQKFEIVLEQIKFYEKNGESLKVKGVPLSERLKSNYDNNK